MKNCRKKIQNKVVAFLLAVMMLLPMFSPLSVYAAVADEFYLAYQYTEDGREVSELKDKNEQLMYKVSELNLDVGDTVDVCRINADWISFVNGKWKTDNAGVATVNSDGVITAVGPGTTTIYLKYTYLVEKSASVKVVVGKDNWNLSVSFHPGLGSYDTPFGMKVGQSVPLYVCGAEDFINVDSNLYSVSWKNSKPSVAELKGTTLYAKEAGTTTVTATLYNKVLGKTYELGARFKVTDPVYDSSEVRWQNEQYLMYGENYKKLFSSSFLAGSSAIEYELLDAAMEVMRDQVEKIDLSALASIFDVSEGLDNAFQAMLNGMDYNYKKDEIHSDAVLYLLEALSKEEDLMATKYAQGVTDAVKKAKSYTSKIEEYADTAGKVDVLKGVLTNTSERELKAILDETKKAAGTLGSILSEGITVAEYLTATIFLYDLENQLLDDLQKCCNSGSTLYQDIEAVRKERAKNPVAHFAQKYLTDKAAGILASALIDVAGSSAAGAFKAAGKIVGILVDATGAGDLEDVAKTSIYMDYLTSVMDRMGHVQIEMRENCNAYSEQKLTEKIDEYEMIYTTYLSMIYPILQELQNLNGYNAELNSDSMIPRNGYDYAQHIAVAMAYYYIAFPNSIEKVDTQQYKVENFVKRLYNILLDREVDDDGLGYWTNILISGVDTGANVAAGIVFSEELGSRNLSNDEFVTGMYQTVFNRQPDASGKRYWLSVLAGGESRTGVALNLLNSAEFGDICDQYGIIQGQAVAPGNTGNSGSTGDTSTQQVQNFVKRLYNILLGREVEADGLNYWSNILISKQDTGAKVAAGIVFSEELRNRNLSNEAYITSLYQTVFDRAPEASGLSYWVGALNAGEPRNNVGREFLNSAEFGDICRKYNIEQGKITVVPVD